MISFVVPAHNEEQLLERTLLAINAAAQELGKPYEVVVVDDSSTDRTAAIARGLGATVVPVQFRQIGRTRNAGANAAQGSLLVFVDADTVVPAATLRASYEAYVAGAVGGGARVRFEGHLAPWTVLGQRLLDLYMRVGRIAGGCYIFCTRAAFDAVGGFDEQLFAMEEIVFSRALQRQGRVVIVREVVISSGRKFGAGSGWRVLRLVLRFARHGPGMLRNRQRLSLWYGRRPDP
jgi:glycosyltransferase involved in cell wall biosynthesis